MHTVIILNQRAMELIKEHRTLFTPFVEDGSISLCSWNESGTDLKSAVPDLPQKIRGKSEWRALVIHHPLYPESEEELPFHRKNPFDFKVNYGREEEIEESKIPLIRLTHMLCGYPELGVKNFVKAYTYKDEKTGAKRVIRASEMTKERYRALSEEQFYQIQTTFLREDYTKEEKEKYRELTRRYRLSEDRPTELLLIGTRPPVKEELHREIQGFWKNHQESESSEFWKRNHYPSISRFLCFSLSDAKNSAYRRDLFRFWLSVLTIALNKIPPSYLQAYRLYRLDAEVSPEEMKQVLSLHLSKLTAARDAVYEQLTLHASAFDRKTEEQDLLSAEPVSILYDRLDTSTVQVDEKLFGLSRDCPTDEYALWVKESEEKRNGLFRLLRAPIRAVDGATEYLRERALDFRDQEYDFSDVDKSELEDEISRLEDQVLLARTRDILDTKKAKKRLLKADSTVKKEIHGRMPKRTVILCGAAALACVFAGYLPYCIRSFSAGVSATGASLLVTLSALLVVAAAGLLSLLVLRKRLCEKISGYNREIRRVLERLNDGMTKLEGYLTDVCTLRKLKEAQKQLSHRQKEQFSIKSVLRAHYRSLEHMLKEETEWCVVFGVTPNIQPISGITLYFNSLIPPKENGIYMLTPEIDEKRLSLNDAGDYLYAPYPIMKRLVIEREAIYDDKEDENQ